MILWCEGTQKASMKAQQRLKERQCVRVTPLKGSELCAAADGPQERSQAKASKRTDNRNGWGEGIGARAQDGAMRQGVCIVTVAVLGCCAIAIAVE